MDHEVVLRLFSEGVDAVGAITDRWAPDRWGAAACGHWDATELTGHLVGVIGWYHSWLDRAEAGDAKPLFAVDDLARENERTLAALAPVSGPERVVLFQREARRYSGRLVQSWDLPYGYPRGTVTAGLHAAVAAAEWHLHAWDLARVAGADHRPSDPAALFVATGECLLVAQGGAGGAIQRRLLPLAARRDPWGRMLQRSGRQRR